MILHILHNTVAPHHTAPGHRSWVVSEMREERDIKTREGEKETGRKDERQRGRKIQKAGEKNKERR